MCGRYYFDIDDKELKEIADEAEKNIYNDYNYGEIFPTNIAPIYIEDNNNLKPILAEWGLPKWDGKGIIINARIETLTEKSMFKKLIKTNRCIVPASAFYEWKRDNSSRKTKDKYIFKNSDSQLYMAGIYNKVTDVNNNKQMNLFDYYEEQNHIYFTIITKEANASVLPVHNRMPIILNKQTMNSWLSSQSIGGFASCKDVSLSSELIK